MSVIRITDPADLAALDGSRHLGVLIALPMLGQSAEGLLEDVQRRCPGMPVAFCRESGPAAEAIRLLRLGATEYFDTWAEAESWCPVPARPSYSHAAWRTFLVGNSPAMQPVFDTIQLLGPRRSTVLIQGETGTGKEMIARALHLASPRGALPMVTVNCTALPDALLEAELFGHTRGAFTGAVQPRIGRFEQAQRSSIFLDEIGDIPVETQAKLLRVLQEKECQRLGSGETIRLDVRVISATNAELEQKMELGKFREDLFYRLNVVSIRLPALRDRWQDIPVLVEHFIDKVCQAEGIPLKRIYDPALEYLQEYSWPGNVRQLENAVERAVILSGDRTVLHPGDFALPRPSVNARTPERKPPSVEVPESGLDLQLTVQKLERTLIEQALRRTGGNKSQAADILGLKRTTLTAKLRALEAAAS